ncbi:universal stress protein [Streptomyces sp. NPDC002004]
MTRRIVAGLDGSAESIAAADWAARAALRRRLPLRLVHAWEGLPDDEPTTLPALQAPRFWAQRVLRHAFDLLTERYPEVSVDAVQIRRPPVPALLAEAESAELVALGSQGLGGIGGFLAGSVAIAVASGAARPVVLVRSGRAPGDRRPPGREDGEAPRDVPRPVLVAVDLRRRGDALLEFAFGEAHLAGAPLHVLHAWHLPGIHGEAEPPAGEAEAAGQGVESALAAALAPWREKFPGVDVLARAVEGRPVHVLTRASETADLLVVGRPTRDAPEGGRLGRIARAAIHHGPCPVAVVPDD